jgi:hypothetical protein
MVNRCPLGPATQWIRDVSPWRPNGYPPGNLPPRPGVGGHRSVHTTQRSRKTSHRARENARVADQRVRFLSGHAQQGCAARRRERAVTLSARPLAGILTLLAAGTRGARVDRDRHPDCRHACTRRRLPGAATAFLRKGDRRSDHAGRHDQSLEPTRDRFAPPTSRRQLESRLTAGAARQSCLSGRTINGAML